jgi:PAS domain S-box-containing protein
VSSTKEQFWEVLDALPEQSIVINHEGTILFANSTFTQFTRASSKTKGKTTLPSLAYEGDREDIRNVIDSLTENPGTVDGFEFRTQGSDGKWYVLQAKGRQLPEQAPVSGIIVTLRDVTERKRREHELQEQNERLEEFAEIVSHDLRNPLQVAKLHLGSITAEESKKSLEKVRQSHERMETIITDVLSLARQGKSIGEMEQASLEMVAHNGWGTVDSKEMDLVVRDDIELQADENRLQQLLENLFRNAAEHAGSETTVTVGPLDLMVTSTRETPPTGFFVADDGPGIPEENRDSVLEFGQSTDPDGTGFGLAIVERIAEAHHWDVQITESLDGGARFEFTEIPERDRLKPDHDI